MKGPKVSIVTPTYNHEAFIGPCIESVLAQTYEDWELLIVDDGSSDGTRDIIDSYAGSDARIRVLCQSNKGIWRLGETYNSALGRARGEFIAVLEGDDFWPPDRLALQLPRFSRIPELILSYGRVAIVRDGHRAGWYRHPGIAGVHDSSTVLRFAYLRASALMSISILVRKSTLQAIGGFHQEEGYPAVDFPTWIRVVALPGKVEFVDRVLGYWRHHGGQVTHDMGVQMAEAGVQVALRHLTTLPPEKAAALDITPQDIIHASRRSLSDAYFGRVRSGLKHRNRTEVEQAVPHLWKHGDFRRKLQALYATAAMHAGWDMEPILRLIERAGTEPT